MATTFHTAIFTREGTLGLTIAECESSSAAVVASVKPGGAAQSRRVRPGDVISKVNGRRVGGYADAQGLYKGLGEKTYSQVGGLEQSYVLPSTCR